LFRKITLLSILGNRFVGDKMKKERSHTCFSTERAPKMPRMASRRKEGQQQDTLEDKLLEEELQIRQSAGADGIITSIEKKKLNKIIKLSLVHEKNTVPAEGCGAYIPAGGGPEKFGGYICCCGMGCEGAYTGGGG
jgi:hypothetical protein